MFRILCVTAFGVHANDQEALLQRLPLRQQDEDETDVDPGKLMHVLERQMHALEHLVADDHKKLESVAHKVLDNGDFHGPPGPPGAKGPAGPRGPKGDKGDTGDVGKVGPQGPEGPQGPAGLSGARGETGPEGPKGPQGNDGEDGETGKEGPEGPQGKNGEMGPAGPKGDKGDKGDAGKKGDKGDKGDAGKKGDKGDKGDTGKKGDKGDKGNGGKVGPRGPAGPRGPTGATGAQGKTGDTGEVGVAVLGADGGFNGHLTPVEGRTHINVVVRYNTLYTYNSAYVGAQNWRIWHHGYKGILATNNANCFIAGLNAKKTYELVGSNDTKLCKGKGVVDITTEGQLRVDGSCVKFNWDRGPLAYDADGKSFKNCMWNVHPRVHRR